MNTLINSDAASWRRVGDSACEHRFLSSTLDYRRITSTSGGSGPCSRRCRGGSTLHTARSQCQQPRNQAASHPVARLDVARIRGVRPPHPASAVVSGRRQAAVDHVGNVVHADIDLLLTAVTKGMLHKGSYFATTLILLPQQSGAQSRYAAAPRGGFQPEPVGWATKPLRLAQDHLGVGAIRAAMRRPWRLLGPDAQSSVHQLSRRSARGHRPHGPVLFDRPTGNARLGDRETVNSG